MYVYADNAATTAMSETALEAMLPCLREEYANPSSLHTPGQRAAEKLTEAREIFARHLGASPAEITGRETPILMDNSRAGGSCSPTASSPERIIFSICWTKRSVSDSALILLKPIAPLPPMLLVIPITTDSILPFIC